MCVIDFYEDLAARVHMQMTTCHMDAAAAEEKRKYQLFEGIQVLQSRCWELVRISIWSSRFCARPNTDNGRKESAVCTALTFT